ncbi:MAG: LemA family protein [Ferruginibacter sp.]
MANRSGKKIWLTAFIILALLAIFFYTSYNGFVRKEELVRKTWNNVQSDYQRRLDLVPNLVNAVKASSDYEKETLTKLIEARANASKINVSGSPAYDDFVKSENAQAEVANSANRVIAVIEKYPDLKSANAFIRLQDQLIGTERRIKFSRKDFNEAVMQYNTAVRSFPGSIAASLFGFREKKGFTADAGTDKAPEINFNK